MSNFNMKLLSYDNKNNTKILKDLSDDWTLRFSIPDALGHISTEKSWQAILIRVMIARTIGKNQKYIKHKRDKKDIDFAREVIWSGGSIIMHNYNLDPNWVSTFVKNICKVTGNVEFSEKIPKIEKTLDLIEKLLVFINQNKINGISKEPIINLLQACKIRIIFESNHSNNLVIKDKSYVNVQNRKPKSTWTSKEKEFENKYSYIYKGVAHTVENYSFYYVAINSEFLSEALSEVEKLLK